MYQAQSQDYLAKVRPDTSIVGRIAFDSWRSSLVRSKYSTACRTMTMTISAGRHVHTASVILTGIKNCGFSDSRPNNSVRKPLSTSSKSAPASRA